MSDADALLAAVCAEPDADLPRLVYADWLDDAGDPVRAEFIRVQIALAADPTDLTLAAREKTLLALHADAWLRPLKARGEPLHGGHGRFCRGFVDEVWLPAGAFLRRADRLFRRAPVRGLHVTHGTREQVLALEDCPHVDRLHELTVAGRHGDVAACAVRKRVRAGWRPAAVHLPNSELTDGGAAVLSLGQADETADWRPRVIDVRMNPLTPVGQGWLRDRFGAAVRLGR